MSKIQIYSPKQVAIGAFIGGPFAAVYFLGKNFACLRNDGARRKTWIYGAVFVAVLFAALPFLPAQFPNYAIPIAYVVVARMIAEKYQMSKQAVQESEGYEFQSSGKVLALSVLFLVVFAAATVLWVIGLAEAGLIQL